MNSKAVVPIENTLYIGIGQFGCVKQIHVFSLTPAACAAPPLSQAKEGAAVAAVYFLASTTESMNRVSPSLKKFREGAGG